MDIGSAKATPGERARVPHHLIDVADPDEPFSAGRYAELAAEAIEGIRERGRVPVIAGGSGLYVRALLAGLASGVESDPEVRLRIAERLAREGVAAIRRRLEEVDPETAWRIHEGDVVRMTRALEVHEITGRPLSAHQAAHGWRGGRYDPVWIGLTEDRALLNSRIDARCDDMMVRGLLEEVRGLAARGYSLDLRPLRSLGYKQMGDVLRGNRMLGDAVADMKKATRRYAKRQLTWFRAQSDIPWFSPSSARDAIRRRALEAFTRTRSRPQREPTGSP
jgi:tRNA dimethylallyltransferase